MRLVKIMKETMDDEDMMTTTKKKITDEQREKNETQERSIEAVPAC